MQPISNWFQFSTRSMLLGVFVICLGLAGYVEWFCPRWQKELALDQIFAAGGEVAFSGQEGTRVSNLNRKETRDAFVRALWGHESRVVSLINLGSHTLSDEVLRHLSQFRDLKSFHCGGSKLPSTGLTFLRNFSQLERLSLCAAKITEEELVSILECRSLHYLGISKTSISEAGLMRLAAMPNMESIEVYEYLLPYDQSVSQPLIPDQISREFWLTKVQVPYLFKEIQADRSHSHHWAPELGVYALENELAKHYLFQIVEGEYETDVQDLAIDGLGYGRGWSSAQPIYRKLMEDPKPHIRMKVLNAVADESESERGDDPLDFNVDAINFIRELGLNDADANVVRLSFDIVCSYLQVVKERISSELYNIIRLELKAAIQEHNLGEECAKWMLQIEKERAEFENPPPPSHSPPVDPLVDPFG